MRQEARLKSLRRAQKHREKIRVVRRFRDADRIDGHVVDVGRRWALFAMSSDGSPDGFVVVQIRDIRRIYWDPADRFIRRSLKAQGAWPPSAPGGRVDLDHGVKELVDSVAATAALVTVHPELKRTDVCYIGRPVRWGRRNLRLQEVDLQGRWEREAVKQRIDQITRVDFARVYEENLALVAGPQPPLIKKQRQK